MQAHALNVALYEHYFMEDNYVRQTMILGPESLPFFLQLLFPRLSAWPWNFKIEMRVGQLACFARSRLQKEILEPFSAARGFQSISVCGNVDGDFACYLMDKMRSLWESTTELLRFSDAYLKKVTLPPRPDSRRPLASTTSKGFTLPFLLTGHTSTIFTLKRRIRTSILASHQP